MKKTIHVNPLFPVFLAIAIVALITLPVEAADEASSIEAASSSINQAFQSILYAEEVGGSVTTLLTKLETAGELLAKAQNSFNSGSLEGVTSIAESARQIADQVNADALTLRDDSLIIAQNGYILTILFSFIGSIVLLVVLVFLWRSFKRSYIKKFLGKKPQLMEKMS